MISEAITQLVKDVGCLLPLSQFGASEADLDRLVSETMFQTRVMGHSSWQLTPQEIRSIFSAAL